jgi:2-polyprenyl-6-methoxyphenol hydroxylase-like FAD-dependent oxidoreductase
LYQEREIRALLKDFPSCTLRTGCEVFSRTEDATTNKTVVGYRDQTGTERFIRTSWLVGADGKRGVVRKKFLEPEGVRQEDGAWTYVGTWVATNLKITTPTPESHPDFPLWALGWTPQRVHDHFWPSGFQ